MNPCSKCLKPLQLCVCEEIGEARANSTFVLILQHPQEPDKVLGSARLTTQILKSSALVTALSRPNLAAALKSTDFKGSIDAKSWAVLYMGTGLIRPQNKPGQVLYQLGTRDKTPRPFEPRKFQGVVVLDGTWSQAKALWWRNPWLLKLQRLVLFPPRPSLYGKLRKEPKREALSTIEAVAYTLEALGEDAALKEHMLSQFEGFLKKVSAVGVQKGRQLLKLAHSERRG